MPSGKLIFSAACGTASFRYPIIRVQRRVQGRHGMSEHLLPDWLTASSACGDSNFHIPINRVLPSAGV